MKKLDLSLTIRLIEKQDLPMLWAISYGPAADLSWMAYDGPYFNNPVLSWDAFVTGWGGESVENPHRGLIEYQNQPIGMVTAYWEDGPLNNWLQFGIVIYSSSLWGKGIATTVIPQWITYLFNLHPQVQRVGYRTWSGNHGMMKVGEACGLTLEARIRKVRFTQDRYFDSLEYGVLRDEWLNQ
ncbi:GNAT family N-acetyltransferase [Listeria monocytogenes]|uniref:GNAT family N-acetyltransferase n=1 Tax=Bacilli TaxID=91061 RepID=UPI000BE10659|nr:MULTISPECIES: GNAT family protein [Bacilli]PDA41260.1 GNAT family N-acetyltransferase [Listeria monocytogenes]PDA50611.1 GNAT family N-acetyltransferase [Listeria monocytogenes]PDA59259.1 GNAT family N-acetyltransferase [Listeria monocytogenes]WHA10240.1 GNAT family protein [Enterococcus montenegrensis]